MEAPKSHSAMLAALVTCGCGAPDATTETVDGVPVVESVQPVWSDGERQLGPDPLVEIGASEGGGPEMFAGPDMATFGDAGRIVTSDGGANRVVVFDSSGAHVRTLGRPGEGPGEFQDVARAYAFPGDSVATFDFGLGRIQVFPVRAGAARTIPAIHEDGGALLFGVLASGSLLAYQRIPLTAPPTAETWDSMRVIVVDRAGSATREVARLARAVVRTDPGRAQALPPRSILAASRDGFYWARSDRYEIHQFDSLGALRRVVRRPVEPEPLGPADRREYSQGTIEAARRLAGEDVARRYETMLEDASFASTRPLFGEAFVDDDERLWISDVPWPSRFDPPPRWSVFSPDGRWLGDVTAPSGVHIQDASADRVLGIWRDELGVEYLRVYELIGA